MILLIDNYDSFTWNLVQRLGEIERAVEVRVVRNDRITAAEALGLHPSHIIISPGPCTPNEAGVSNEIVRTAAGRIPLLGVCLGHQCMGQVNGMRVERHTRIVHGKTSPIRHKGEGVFAGLRDGFTAARYHSLAVLAEPLPEALEVTAWTEDGEIMGLRHKTRPIHGVQFHPESIATEGGHQLLTNFLALAGVKRPAAA